MALTSMSPNLPPAALKELLSHLEDNRGILLQYDAGKQQLVPYPWYVWFELI